MALFASRYARAFADVVTQYKLPVDKVETQLNDFLETWDHSAQLREVFEDPSVPGVQKVAALDKMQGGLRQYPQVRNLLAVLIHHDRIGAVHEVVAEYQKELQARMGIRQAEVTTARPLNDADKQMLIDQVGKLAKGEVRATFKQDPSILGGAIVRMGSTVYDGSVLGRVERLKAELER